MFLDESNFDEVFDDYLLKDNLKIKFHNFQDTAQDYYRDNFNDDILEEDIRILSDEDENFKLNQKRKKN